MQFLLSSLPFPPSLMQFFCYCFAMRMCLWFCKHGEICCSHFLILQVLGEKWWDSSGRVCAPASHWRSSSVSWKETGPRRARFSHLKIVAYGEFSPFKISEKYLSPSDVYIYTRKGWTASWKGLLLSSWLQREPCQLHQRSCLPCRGLKLEETSLTKHVLYRYFCNSSLASLTVLDRSPAAGWPAHRGLSSSGLPLQLMGLTRQWEHFL